MSHESKLYLQNNMAFPCHPARLHAGTRHTLGVEARTQEAELKALAHLLENQRIGALKPMAEDPFRALARTFNVFQAKSRRDRLEC